MSEWTRPRAASDPSMENHLHRPTRPRSFWDQLVLATITVPLVFAAVLTWRLVGFLLLHPLFHEPVLNGTITWPYGDSPRFLGVLVDDLSTYVGLIPSILFGTCLALEWLRSPWWGWLGSAVLLGGLTGLIVYLGNPNWLGVEYGCLTHIGWLWACGVGYALRWFWRFTRVT